jgi:hypothetical protein
LDSSRTETATRPDPVPPRLTAQEAIDGWDQHKRQMSALLRQAAPDAAWLTEFAQAMERMRALARRDVDMALYLLLQAAASELDQYSAHHAMLCALVGEACAQWFEWPADEVDTFVRAALTMNLSMSTLQNTLARQVGPLSQAQRDEIAAHAEKSALLLTTAGVGDGLWIDVVRAHHQKPAAGSTASSAAQRLAQLLRRVDVYTAKLSRRATREPASPALAARDACLDADGNPDAIGATVLRTLGLYPPGCYVQLANGDLGIVVKRGAKAHTPIVAALRRADGGTHIQPPWVDTGRRGHGVVRGATAREVKFSLHHLRTLSGG